MAELSLSRFADKLDDLMPAIMRESLKQHAEEFYKVKVTMPQFFVMNLLHKHGISRMKDMAQYMHITAAGMTGIMDRLVREGYVARISDPEDRRTVKVKLTAKGSSLVEKIVSQRRKTIMTMFSKISQRERNDYIRILNHVKEHLSD